MTDEPTTPTADLGAGDAAEPVTLILAWPDGGPQDPPTRQEVLLSIARATGEDLPVLEDIDADEGGEGAGGEGIHWGSVVRRPGGHETIVWAEPARPNADEELAATGGRAFHHVIGLETLLDERHPLGDFAGVLALALDAAPGAAAVLDANTGTWSSRDELESLLDASAAAAGDDEPGVHLPPEVLWTVHAVGGPPGARLDDGSLPGDAPLWLHTHGLGRAGRPELEMLEVPGALGGAAARLLSIIAGRLLEEPAAAAGATVEVGPDLAVSLQDWRDCAPFVADGAAGGAGDRTGDLGEAHGGHRLVVCGLEPEGSFRAVWTAPRTVLERLDRGDVPLFLSRGEVRHRRRLAKTRWPEAATAFASLRGSVARDTGDLLVKAPYGGGAGRPVEHLWFRVREVAADEVRARLASPPHGDVGLAEGDAVAIAASAIDDWIFMTPHGGFGPDRTDALWRSVDLLRAGDVRAAREPGA